jgi:hypothetical protein
MLPAASGAVQAAQFLLTHGLASVGFLRRLLAQADVGGYRPVYPISLIACIEQ